MNNETGTRRASLDLVFLAVLIAIGALLGYAALGYLTHVSPTPVRGIDVVRFTARQSRDISLFGAYAGAALFVGFGLVNRMLRGSMFRVTGPLGLFITLIAAYLVGIVALPGVVIWRLWRLAGSFGGTTVCR